MLHSRAPDGYLIDGLTVWEDLEVNGAVAQGFRISTLDARVAADLVQDELRDRLAGFYQNLPPDVCLQHRYRPNCPFASVLDDYERVTATSPFPVVRARREAHSRRFRGLHRSQQLRAEDLHVFFASRVNNLGSFKITREAKASQARMLLTHYRGAFARLGDQLRSAIGELATVTPLGDREHFRLLERTIDPSVEDMPGGSAKNFEPGLSIGEQLFSSGIAGNTPHGIHSHGYYQALLTLKACQNRSESGLFHALTTLPFNRYEVVVNVQPIDVEKLIRRKEETIATRAKENVIAARTGDASVAKDESNRLEEEQIRRLYRGNQKMFAATYAVRVWAKTEAELTSMTALARRALDGMHGAQSYLATLSTTTRKLYFATWPGWTFGYDKRAIEMVDLDLADIVPFTGTFEGRPDAAEILLDGASRQTLSHAPRAIVAVPSFLGTPSTAQHTLFVGSTGSGKTTTLNDMAFQSSPYYAYECFIEEGSDYTAYTEAHGCKTIRVQTDGTHTINYLETGGLPLSATHISFASALALHMTGTTKASEAVARRKAILTQYLRVLYGNAAADWLRKHRDEAQVVMREAYAVREWHRLNMTNDDSLTDAWAAVRDGLAAKNDRVGAFVAGLADEDIFRFAHDSSTRSLLENHVFTRFRADEYPQHAAFAELMLTHRMPEFRSDELNDIATMLRNWTALEGDYGPLFDGVSTLPLDSRVVHFELGKIPEEQRELKTAVSLLMTGKVRQRIVSMPRGLRKRTVIEEMMRFLDVPDADKLIVEFCAQMRKYNCVVWMVVQQLQKLLDTGIAPYVIGNCRQYIIMKQLDAGDVAILASRLPGKFPEPLQQEILGFQTPENLPPDDRYASLAYYNPNLVPPLAGTARLYLPKTG
jgi:hypothetical protein